MLNLFASKLGLELVCLDVLVFVGRRFELLVLGVVGLELVRFHLVVFVGAVELFEFALHRDLLVENGACTS